MSTRLITLTVPNDFEIPSFLHKATPQQIAHALELSDAILEAGENFRNDSNIKHYQDKIRQLQITVDSTREEAVRLLKAETNGEVSGLKAQIQNLQHHNEKFESLYKEEKQEHKKTREKLDEAQEKLQHRIAVQSNSSKRGFEGEKDFQMITSTIKEDWKLQSVGKTKESADFHSIIHTVEVRFEVKNHKDKVPYSENVDKFERDMKKHPSTKVGVFVALTACIEKMEDSISIRWTDDKQLLIFIPYFLTRDLSYTYDMIEGFIRTIKHIKPLLETKDTSKDIQALTDKIKDTIKTIEMLDKQIETIESEHKDYNRRMLVHYASLKSIVTSTLTALTGKEQEVKTVKRKSKKKDENASD